MNPFNSDTVALLCVTLLIILFVGEPDLMQAIIFALTGGKLTAPCQP
jgi:hypothetical protein